MNDVLDFLTESQLQLYTEMYYGKRKEFEVCEKLIARISDKLNMTKDYQYINDFPENKLLENEIKKVFGFRTVHIHWEYRNIPNAYTIVGSHLHRDPRSRYILLDKKKGYYDEKHQDVLFVCLYAGLLTKNKLTPDELLGVMLHEIGHNFDYSIYNTISEVAKISLTYAVYGLAAAAAIVGTGSIGYGILLMVIGGCNAYSSQQPYIPGTWKNKYYKNRAKEEKEAIKHPESRQAQEKMLELRRKVHVWSTIYGAPLRTVLNIALSPINIIVSPIIQFFSIGGKASEQFADSFATAYGYGPSMIRGLDKLSEYPKELKNSSSYTKVMYDLGCINYEIISAMQEIHGTHQERIKASINKMRTDLKNGDFSPEMKNDLERELSQLEELYKQYLTVDPEKKNGISVGVRKIINTVFGGIPNIARFIKNQV